MTREEAIGNLIHAIRWNDMPKKESLEMAIKALKQEPKTDILEQIQKIVEEWESDSWTDGLSYECMVKIARLLESGE